MNFLQLAQRTQKECAVTGTLTTVTNQSGELGRVVDWVSTAYNDICLLYNEWEFLHSSFTLTTTPGTAEYHISVFTDTRVVGATVGFSQWLYDTFWIYRVSSGLASRMYLPYQPYNYFREQWLMRPFAQMQPIAFSILPQEDSIVLAPTPDAAYVLNGDYQRDASTFDTDEDEPLFPPRFHMAIVWLAQRMYAEYQEDSGLYDAAERKYRTILNALTLDQLPIVQLAGPLV